MTKKLATKPPSTKKNGSQPFDISALIKKKEPGIFTPQEEEYLSREPRRNRIHLQNMLNKKQHSKSIPRRIRVLMSDMCEQHKLDIFYKLGGYTDQKFIDWVDRALQLPLGKMTLRPKTDARAVLKHAREIMDVEITGHTNAKHEILRLLSDWVHGGGKSGFALGLEGEPGIGKTSFAKQAIAKGLGRPFYFISLGGASDISTLMGHSYTYEGAVPGRLVECLTTSKVMDPVIFFDELDKLSDTQKGEEIANCLIHLTDPIQNNNIIDRYFHGIPLDFSRAIFVFSYNDPRRVHPVLLDRIRRIQMQSPRSDRKPQFVRRIYCPVPSAWSKAYRSQLMMM